MAVFTAIASAIGAIGSFIGGLGAIGSFGLKVAVGLGLSLAQKALMGEQKVEKPKFAVEGQLQTGADLPQSFILGQYMTGGSLPYANTWTVDSKKPNAQMSWVILLSDLPCQSLDGIYVDGEPCALGAELPELEGAPGYGRNQHVDGYDGYLRVTFYNGSQTEAPPYLVNTIGTFNDRPYSPSRVGFGRAYVHVSARLKEELFSGFPSFKFVVSGLPLYDITKDSTAGGSGPHRWSDPSTWGGDGDFLPAVQAYNLLRGIYWQGQWIYGIQDISPAQLPAAHWIKQIHKCRALVKGHGGVMEPRYRSGGEFPLNVPVIDAVAELMNSCSGRFAESGGIYKIHVGEPDEPVFSFTDDDIITTEEQSFTPFFGLADTVNGMTAKYPNPKEGWNYDAAPPRYRPDLELLDGKRRLMSEVTFEFVPYLSQVQRLMREALEEARRARRHTHVLPPEAGEIEPGDVVEWTSARNGYQTKRFRVDGFVDKANLDCLLDLTEIAPAAYSFPEGDYRPQPTGNLVIRRPPAQPIVDWSAEPYELLSPNGSKRPAILLGWNRDVEDVRAVRFQVRLKGTEVVVHQGRTDEVDAGSIIITQGLLRKTLYQARGIYLPNSDRTTIWSDWVDVETPEARLTAVDFEPIEWDGIADEVRDEIDRIVAEVKQIPVTAGDVRTLRDAILNLALRAEDQALVGYAERRKIVRDVAVEIAGTRAAFREAIDTAAGEGSALAQAVRTLGVDLGGRASAEIVEALTVRVTATENGLQTEVARIDGLSTAIGEKASAEALNAALARIDENEGDIAVLVQELGSLTATVAGKATSEALTAVVARVEFTENAISSLTQQMSQLNATIAGKASAEALNALVLKVTDVEGKTTSQGDAITRLTSGLGDAGSQNLLYNPSFERFDANGTATGWAGGGTLPTQYRTFSNVPSTLEPGGRCQRIGYEELSTSTRVDLYTDVPYRVPVSAGQPVAGSIHVRGTSGVRCRVILQYRDSAGALIASQFADHSVSPSWQRFAAKGIAPAGAVAVGIVAQNYGDGATSGFLMLDRAQVQIGTEVTGWQDNNRMLADDAAANASATNALTTKVTAAEGKIEAQAASLTSVEAKADQATASGLMKLEAQLGPHPSGVAARFSILLRSSTGSGFTNNAGIVLELLTNGTSRMAINAGVIGINNKFLVDNEGNVTIRSATTGARLMMSNSLLRVYDANNVERVRLGVW